MRNFIIAFFMVVTVVIGYSQTNDGTVNAVPATDTKPEGANALPEIQNRPNIGSLSKVFKVVRDAREKKIKSSAITGPLSPKTSESFLPEHMYYDMPMRGGLIGTPTIPISFSRLVYDIPSAQWNLVPNLAIGVGYTWMVGNFTITKENLIHVDPVIVFWCRCKPWCYIRGGAAKYTHNTKYSNKRNGWGFPGSFSYSSIWWI